MLNSLPSHCATALEGRRIAAEGAVLRFCSYPRSRRRAAYLISRCLNLLLFSIHAEFPLLSLLWLHVAQLEVATTLWSILSCFFPLLFLALSNINGTLTDSPITGLPSVSRTGETHQILR